MNIAGIFLRLNKKGSDYPVSNRLKRALTVACICLSAMSAHADRHATAWKQDVALQDGRTIVVDRVSEQGSFDPALNARIEIGQELTFTHPDTRERISWRVPQGLLPFMLDFDAGVPYYIFKTHTLADYNRWECPNPPWIAYRFERGAWVRIALESVQVRFTTPNLMAMAKSYKRYVGDGYVTLQEYGAYMLGIAPIYRSIGRESINANVHGCFPSVLEKLGRSNEITEPYGKGVRK